MVVSNIQLFEFRASSHPCPAVAVVSTPTTSSSSTSTLPHLNTLSLLHNNYPPLSSSEQFPDFVTNMPTTSTVNCGRPSEMPIISSNPLHPSICELGQFNNGQIQSTNEQSRASNGEDLFINCEVQYVNDNQSQRKKSYDAGSTHIINENQSLNNQIASHCTQSLQSVMPQSQNTNSDYSNNNIVRPSPIISEATNTYAYATPLSLPTHPPLMTMNTTTTTTMKTNPTTSSASCSQSLVKPLIKTNLYDRFPPPTPVLVPATPQTSVLTRCCISVVNVTSTNQNVAVADTPTITKGLSYAYICNESLTSLYVY